MNKVTLLLAAVLALPATAMAQTAPQPPTAPTPVAPAMAPQHIRHRMSDADMQAMMAKMKANMAKIEAAHKALRAKILGSLTPAHKAYFANLIGQLAVSTSPDWNGAAARLNATLSATEKSKILAIHADAIKQMGAMMPPMGMDGMARMHGEMRMKHTLTAGDILMHLAGPGGPGEGMPMMMRVERFGHGDMNWKRTSPMPPVAPATPAAAPTSTP